MFFGMVILIALIVFILGPRVKVALFWDTTKTRIASSGTDAQMTSADLRALRESLHVQESAVEGVIDGAEKHIVFSSETRPKRTRYCVLYVHGYSACRQEISPVPENIAKSLHANLYSTRLSGHGMDGQSLAEATPSDWLFDIMEAWTVAKKLGEQIVVISTSTGGSLSAWMAQQPEVKPTLAAMIMVSPNFKPYHRATPLFLWPWARYWMPLLAGTTYGWEPSNEGGAKYWTYSYPTSALYGLTALVKSIRKSALGTIETPTLFLYSDEDKVVDARATDAAMRRWGSSTKHRIAVAAEENDNNHVVTGDIVRPRTTAQFTSDILNFLKQHAL